MTGKRISPQERDALLHTLYTTRAHVEKRITKLRSEIRRLNEDLQARERQLDDIEQSIYWLREE